MQKVLVTGGLGYVGGRIVEKLISANAYEVLIATRKTEILPNDYFDITKVKLIDSNLLFSDAGQLPEDIDCIIHLAAFNEIDCAANPVAAAEFNIIASLKLLNKAVKQKVGQFIYFSTAHVYGAPLQGEITEETIARPIHPYAITHKAFEDFVLAARDKGEIDGIVVRLSNSFGYPVWPDVNRWTLLVNDLCRQAVTTGILKLHSAGKQERDFITLTDVAAAALFLMNDQGVKSTNGLFNLGGNQTLTIEKMTALIADRCRFILGREVSVNIPLPTAQELKKYDPLVLSNRKLEQAGFQWQSNSIEEIDLLLMFCNKNFGALKNSQIQ